MIKETVDRGYCLHLSDMGEHKVEESRGMGEFLFFALLTFSPLPFLKKKFDCRIIALHYCVSICCTAASAMGIHMSLPFEPPSHLLPIPTFWVVADHQVQLPASYSKFPLVICLMHGDVYVSVSLSQFIPPSSSPTVSTSLFSMSGSPLLPCRQTHQYHLLDSIYMH